MIYPKIGFKFGQKAVSRIKWHKWERSIHFGVEIACCCIDWITLFQQTHFRTFNFMMVFEKASAKNEGENMPKSFDPTQWIIHQWCESGFYWFPLFSRYLTSARMNDDIGHISFIPHRLLFTGSFSVPFGWFSNAFEMPWKSAFSKAFFILTLIQHSEWWKRQNRRQEHRIW